MTSLVIIGAGECGGRAALSLRDRGFDGEITLVGNEDYAPYERPPLSKQGLLDAVAPTFIASPKDYADRRINLRMGTTATHLDRRGKTVVFSTGETVAYDRALLATGSRPRLLSGAPENSSRILYLRTHIDALRIGQHLSAASRIAILGGGFIGLELAATARRIGASVVLLEGLPRILSRGVPTDVAKVIAARHAAEGVEIVCDAHVEDVVVEADSVRISLLDGRLISSDILIVGIGSQPNVELAIEAGLAIDNGIAVNQYLRTTDPDIFAAGDCCSFPLAVYSDRRVRLESWRSAQEHGVLSAANLLGGEESVTAVPWFWSDQYELTLQVAGLPTGCSQSVRRDLGENAFIIFELDETGRLLSASGVGPGNTVAREIRLAEMLIAAGKSPDPIALAHPETKLKSLLVA